MKKIYFLYLLAAFVLVSTAIACGGSDSSDEYTEIPEDYSPVVANLNEVPYATLSQYKLFEGDMKNLSPAKKVLPYDLINSLFTDYAKKKRFVWMPKGTKATYTSDSEVLDFPVGAVLVKNFYYDATQMGQQRIIETRLMIKKADGWIFADYIWNEAQTEALLNTEGANIDITWNENGVAMNTAYHVPTQYECTNCHRLAAKNTAIGPKPQNLNKTFTYTSGSKNQLSAWITEGYLDTAPGTIASVTDWTDAAQPLEIRARSYFDINCAHCHQPGAFCNEVPLNFKFSKTEDPVNMGICQTAIDPMKGYDHIIEKQNAEASLLHFKMNTNDPNHRMPLIGRTVIHTEGLFLIDSWINAMDTPCD